MALYMTRRPLCIDSKLVEKIDRLGVTNTDSVYRCALNKDTPFSTYFSQKGRAISQRLQGAERFLENIEPFHRKVRITILEDRPTLFKVQDHQIFIGQTLFETPGHLEKALAKVWYRERADAFFVNETLLEEVVTDFLTFGIRGQLDIQDPINHQEVQTKNSKWPYVIKSAQGYCESPWKFSEHIAICSRSQEEKNALKDVALEYSLRPLLSSSWIESYKDLGMFEQAEFLRTFAQLLRADHVPPLAIIRSPVVAVAGSPIMEAAEAVKNVNQFIAASTVARDSVVHRAFLGMLTNELKTAGFNDSFSEAFFDYLFVSEQPLSDKSKIYTQFKELSQLYPNVHMALRDNESVWMLPAKYPIPLKSFGEIKASRVIAEKCGEFNFNFVLSFAQVTDKLLVVDSCDKKNEIRYSRYILHGPEGFGSQNRGVAFIQFHIPSLMMKRNQLVGVPNIYELVQKREIDNPGFQSLGWQELNWNENAKAYHPKAPVDVIEWFRAPEKKVKDN